MATPDQKAAVKRVCAAVTALNSALYGAGAEEVYIELRHLNVGGSRNGSYQVTTMETRETVLPG